jgi:lipoate-protein ligase B
VIFLDWGLIPYQAALEKQLALVDEVALTEAHPGYVIFCTHPAVVTLGRQSKPEDVTSWRGDIVEVSRGGRATYHGPSQLIVYIVMNIKAARKNRGPQEIRGFLRNFEESIVQSVKKFGIQAFGRSLENVDDTGVWVETEHGIKKMTSIGIAVKKWVTFHGAAINMDRDPNAFLGINPCGYGSEKMISIEGLTGKKINLEDFKKILKPNFESLI